MIIKSKEIADNFFLLEKCESFGDYARIYGDQIPKSFEDLNIIYFPLFPLEFDIDLFQSLTMPDKLPKPGTRDGLDKNIIIRNQLNFSFDESHILSKVIPDKKLALYLQSQISSVKWQIREAMRIFFPKCFSLREIDISWHFTKHKGHDLSFDNHANPISVTQEQELQRIKIFINVDSEPLTWRTSLTLPDFLKNEKQSLPSTLPNDMNILNEYIYSKRLLNNCKYHEIRIPTLSAIMFNSESIAHQYISGRRMIAGNFVSLPEDMITPDKLVYYQLPRWLEQNGYQIRDLG